MLAKVFRVTCTSLLITSSLAILAQTTHADSLTVLEQIQHSAPDSLPLDLELHLPTEDWLQGLLAGEDEYFIEVIPTATGEGVAVGIFTCEDRSPACLLASFATLEENSELAQTALQRHYAAAAPITFAPEVQGYLIDSLRTTPQSPLSSVAWAQDRQVHIVRFPAEERQLGLYLARSMALSAPTASNVAARPFAENEPAASPSPAHQGQIIELPADDLMEQWQPLAEYLPPLVKMRLPTRMLLWEKHQGQPDYQLEVIATGHSESLTASVFTCEATTPDCFLGHFAALSNTSAAANQTYLQHQQGGNPFTLRADITAYVLEQVEADVFSPLTSIMWRQDDQLYRVQFPSAARQALLFTAQSMVDGPTIVSSNVASLGSITQVEPTLEPMAEEIGAPPTSSLRVADGISTNEIAQNSSPNLEIDTIDSGQLAQERLTEIEIGRIEVLGSTVFSAEDFQPIFEEVGLQAEVGDGETQTIVLPQLRNLANGITQLYVDQGYITSQAVAPPALAALPIGATVQLPIIEGSLNEIKIEGTENLQDNYIRSRLELGVTTPLRIDRIEEQLRLLQVDPNLASVEATLQPTGTQGLSDLQVMVEEASRFVAGISADNYSPPRVGSERIGVELGLRNLTGLGDSLSGSYFRSTTGGANVFDFRYTVPLNAMNGTLQLRAAPEENRVTQRGFEALGLRGEIERYGVSYRQPIVRSLNEEFALSFGFDFEEGQTFVFDDNPSPFGIGPDEDGISRTSVFTFGQDYVQRDALGAWAVRSQFNFGTGLFDATANSGSVPDGQFFSWLLQGQRLQRLNDRHLLVFGGDLQLTPDTLLPSQQFSIGGGQSVRGFRQSARSGDNGFRLSIEDRITIRRVPSGDPEFQLAPFADLGYVWNTPGNPNPSSDQTFLAGVGMGVIFDWLFGVEGFSARVDYALPLVDLEDRGDNAQDRGFYFRVNYRSQ